MQETPMLFPMSSTEFWKQIKTIMEEVVEQKLNASIRNNGYQQNAMYWGGNCRYFEALLARTHKCGFLLCWLKEHRISAQQKALTLVRIIQTYH